MAKSPLGSDYDRMRARRNRRMRKIESDHAKLNSNRVSGIRSLSTPAAEATAKLPGISMWWMAVWILVFSPLARLRREGRAWPQLHVEGNGTRHLQQRSREDKGAAEFKSRSRADEADRE